jgi:hypothetical protein
VVEVNPTNSAMRDITVYPVADQYGKTLLTFTVGDGTNGASAAALLTVNGVNDQPSFSLVTNLVVAPNNAGYTNPIIATAFAGANEGTQTLKYYITNAAPGLFAAQPAISPAGVLTFKPKGGTDVGPATLTVVVKDSGGVLNNGKDLSESQQLTIQLVAP